MASRKNTRALRVEAAMSSAESTLITLGIELDRIGVEYASLQAQVDMLRDKLDVAMKDNRKLRRRLGIKASLSL